MIDNNAIGHLVPYKQGFHVRCMKCSAKKSNGQLGSPVYPINIGPYSQTCIDCGETLIKGLQSMKGGPLNLFDGV